MKTKKMNVPEISVVIPVYNAENYLKQAIDSVLAQTFENFELIIINDGSTDDTLSIIASCNDGRIVIINNNHCFIDSLNKGISMARGQYIARMDADDIMVDNRLEVQLEFLKKNPTIDVCGGWIELFGEVEKIIQKEECHEKIILKALYENPMAHPSVMMKTKLRNLFPYSQGIYYMYQDNYGYAEDYKLWIDLICRGCKLANLPKVILKYRVSEFQVTSIHKKDMDTSTVKVETEYINFIMSKIVEVDESFFDVINQSLRLYKDKKITFKAFRNIIRSIAECVINGHI